jgi:hypothetical protein
VLPPDWVDHLAIAANRWRSTEGRQLRSGPPWRMASGAGAARAGGPLPARVPGPGRESAAAARGPGNDLAAVREWAKRNGYQVNDRGRISATVQAAYDAAH